MCTHIWWVESPIKGKCKGTCKLCGEVKEFIGDDSCWDSKYGKMMRGMSLYAVERFEREQLPKVSSKRHNVPR